MSALVAFSNSVKNETADAVYAMPATPLQVRLWNLHQIAGPDPAWNVAVRFRLSGPLDREKFEASLQRLATRHEALRTSLQLHRDTLVQRIAARATLPVEWCDLRSLSAGAQNAEVEHLSLAHARQLLPLDSAPLLRVRILRLGDHEHLLLWNAHHSVCDGWSVGLLARDLMDCYSQLLSGSEPAARDALDYGDYAVWLDAQRGTPEYEGHRNYWKHRLHGLEMQKLPAQWRHADPAATAPVILSTLLPREVTDGLLRVAQEHNATFFHAVLAAFALFMRLQQEQAEVALGTPLSGRDQTELESIVGTFVNYLPLRFRVDEEMTYSALLQDVRDLVTESLEHAQFRYEDMLADLQSGGAPVSGDNSLFPMAFICQQDFVRPIAGAGLALTAIPSVSPGALHPLTVFMVERADGWRLSCEVDNQIVSAVAGSALLKDYQRLLSAIGAHPRDMVAELARRAELTSTAKNISRKTHPSDKAHGPAPLLFMPKAEKRFEPEHAQDLVRIPATEFQKRFWRLDTLNPGGIAYHVRIRMQLEGPLDIEALAEAVMKVARRHEILRTTLEKKDDQIWQVIHPELPIDFRFLVSETMAPDTLRSEAQRLADQAILDREGQVAFSLITGPLFRIRVMQLEKDRHWLAITLSHGIVDGWAGGFFLEQLQLAYEQCRTGTSNATQKPSVQFSVYAKAERSLLASSEKDRRLTWWREYLKGVWTPLVLPRDFEESPASEGDIRAALETTLLDSETVLQARRFARECQTTSFAVFGALLQALLSRYSGQNDVLFLTPLANRTDNTETILGPLADPICLTGHIGAQTTFRELVTRLSRESMDAMENTLPLNIATPLVDMRVEGRYYPLNQIVFFYQRAFVHDMEWKDLQVKSLPDVPSVTGSEWQLGVVERSEGIFLEFLYDATLYSQATIQRVVRHYARFLARAVREPDTALAQLEILTPEDLQHDFAGTSLLPVIQSLLPGPPGGTALQASGVEEKNHVPAAQSELSPGQRDILRIWRQLFKIEDLSIESNFFDLGGHSLLLARLQIVVKREFHVQLTAADVFRYPTVATLAAWLDRAQTIAKLAEAHAAGASLIHNPRIIPIQPLGAGRPIFVISQSMIFRTLAAELGPNQPVYAIQMLDQDTPAMASANFEELADFYVRLIREVQPTGPYRLAGWCVSGWIAYGVARRLEQQKEEIEMLMIIDSWAPGYWNDAPKMLRSLMLTIYEVQRSRWVGRRLRHSSKSVEDSSIRRCLDGFLAVTRKLNARIRRTYVPGQPGDAEEMERTAQLQSKARLAAQTGPLQGRALLFRSEEEPHGPLLAPDMGWTHVIGRPVLVEMLPGDHHEIFDLPGARIMAERAREILDQGADPFAPTGSHDKNAKPGVPSNPLVEA